MLKNIRQPRQTRQRGFTLFSLVFWAVLIVAVAVVGSKVTPTVIEYWACIKGAKLAANESTPDAARIAFDRYTTVGYINAISGKDLNITPGAGGSLRIAFAYDKEIPIAGPVYLLIKYHGSSSSSFYAE